MNDSKKISEKKRENIFDSITQKSVCFGIGWADSGEIDELNILNATYLAMRRAVENMNIRPQFALVDGNRMKGLDIPFECIVKGAVSYTHLRRLNIL